MNQSVKGIVVGVAALAVMGAGAGLMLTGHPAEEPKPQSTGKVAAQQTQSPMQAAIAEVAAGKATLIDVRTPAEYAAGHALGASNFDSVDVEAGQLPAVAKDAKIYLYCHSGRRAGIVLGKMKAAGFTDVTNLGAFDSWLAAGGARG